MVALILGYFFFKNNGKFVSLLIFDTVGAVDETYIAWKYQEAGHNLINLILWKKNKTRQSYRNEIVNQHLKYSKNYKKVW